MNESTTSDVSKLTKIQRAILTVGLLIYLGLVVLAPLSNPTSTRNLTAPAADFVEPIHQSLFLDHGYRFFAPDPGPSHLVYYEVKTDSGGVIQGHFPDADETWPRLLYHRWFMLSETLYEEHAFTPEKQSFDNSQMELATAVDQLKKEGHFRQSDRLKKELVQQRTQYDQAVKRIDRLVSAVAEHVLKKCDGREITLGFRERVIPQPIDIATGSKLDDDRYLMPFQPFAKFRAGEEGALRQLPLPTQTDETIELLPDVLRRGQ